MERDFLHPLKNFSKGKRLVDPEHVQRIYMSKGGATDIGPGPGSELAHPADRVLLNEVRVEERRRADG